MVDSLHLRFAATDRSYFAIIKKEIHALAVEHRFTEKKLGEIDIIIAEIVSNLGKHANGGEIFVKLVEIKKIQGLEIIAIDSGPGMSDVKSMMKDGASTKNTLGQGLGAIKRLSNDCQIYSQKGWGTLLLARVYNEEIPFIKQKSPFDVRSFILPKPGEIECGDGFFCKQTEDYIKLFLGDGLGHGKEAAFAVKQAMEACRLCYEESPVENLRFINQAVKKTRGLVATVAVFNIKALKWKICGVGNIATRIIGNNMMKTHSPYNGIVGLNIPNTMNDQEVEYEPGQLLIMCSDGIKSKWDALKFPGILRHDLSLFNAALFKDHARNTDDVSIASCKINL